MKKLFLILLISLCLTSSAYADSRNFSFKVNKTKINVRTPDGFYESSYIAPGRLDMAKTLLPQTLNVQAVLLPKGVTDFERLTRYIILVTEKRLEKRKITQKDFNNLRELLREQQFTLLNKWKEKIDEEVEAGALRISNESGLKYKFLVGETTPLGVFIDNKKVISINTISNMKTSLEGTNYDFLQVASSSMVFVKNKIIMAYIYSDFDSEKDIIWIEDKTKETVNLLIKNN